MIKVCSEIVAELIQAHDAGKDINLNGLKQRYSRKHKAQNQPKLVDIIAAIPEQYKAVLLPNLKAKPVRTASGVSFTLEFSTTFNAPQFWKIQYHEEPPILTLQFLGFQ